MFSKIFNSLKYHPKDNLYKSFLKEFFAFGFKQVLSCLFPAFIFCMLTFSKFVHIPFIPRYDFLLLACIIMQAIMYFSKLETGLELLVITMFHLIGLVMEIYKVHVGSWSYPEDAFTKIAGVPLYSGFMYASVGSYVCQAWRWFDLRIQHWPGTASSIFISLFIYANFFTNYYLPDIR